MDQCNNLQGQSLLSTLPVLIGSYALHQYTKSIEYKDIDIITTSCIRNKIPSQYSSAKIDQNIINPDIPSSLSLIFNYCNSNKEKLKIITILDTIDVVVCPRTLLYALKKSHIHRIVPHTKDFTTNIEIWHKNVKQYLQLRNNNDMHYKILDNIIYNNDKTPSYEIIRQVFYAGFDEINKSIGDTHVSLDEEKDKFFDDKVERFYDHDKLHVLVAKANRDESEPIYLKYQDSNSVNLNKDKFMVDNVTNHINMFNEEIMVLLLERKLLPTIINCYAKVAKPYDGYNKIRFEADVKEIVANYACNLCGNGHSWLRTYVIDHANYLKNYDLNMLENIARTVLKELNITLPINIDAVVPTMTYVVNKNSGEFSDLLDACEYSNTDYVKCDKNDTNAITCNDGKKKWYLPIDTIDNIFFREKVMGLIADFNRNSTQTYVFNIEKYYYVYNTIIGCGLCYNDDSGNWKHFVLDVSFDSYGDDYISAYCQYVNYCESDEDKDMVKKNSNDSYQPRYECGTYYNSRGQYCGEINGYIGSRKDDDYTDGDYDLENLSLGSYGTLPKFLHSFMHYVGSEYFGFGSGENKERYDRHYTEFERYYDSDDSDSD